MRCDHYNFIQFHLGNSSGRHSSGDSAEKQMLISWHRRRELVWRKQLTAAWQVSSGQPDNSFSTDPWTDVVMVNNGWEWVQLNGAVNHSQFCHLGSWGALQNPKQVVSFTGLQSIKSWFYRVGLPSSWFNFDTLPFKAIDWHNPVLFMLVVSSTVQPEFGAQNIWQLNAMQCKRSQANCLQPFAE